MHIDNPTKVLAYMRCNNGFLDRNAQIACCPGVAMRDLQFLLDKSYIRTIIHTVDDNRYWQIYVLHHHLSLHVDD